MRVIKPPKTTAREVKVSCHHCAATLAVKPVDATSEDFNDRDGPVYVFECPCCSGRIWVNTSKFEEPSRRGG